MSAKDYFRPRGDITTVLDLTDRDSQDNTYFPLDTTHSWFHRGEIGSSNHTIYPSALSVQEFTQRGPAQWGQKLSFEIGSLPAGDLLQSVILQIRLGSWYNGTTVQQLSNGIIQPDLPTNAAEYWTFANSLGTSIIEYAEFIVNDQTIERLTGEFIRMFLNVYSDVNTAIGYSADGIGTASYSYLSNQPIGGVEPVLQTAFNPNRPFPTEDGTYFCILPFFFIRTRLKEVFPLLACNEGNVRIDVKLRPFDQLVRKYIGYRANCTEVPLNSTVTFKTTADPLITVTTNTLACAPS